MPQMHGSRIRTVPMSLLYPGEALLGDLAAGVEGALRFFSARPHLRVGGPTNPASGRGALPATVAQAIVAHQRRLGGDGWSLDNAESLAGGRATCILTGQQAGLLGGPAYTAYKIATAVRLARQETDLTGRRCVPVFWLASEDHDLIEANHAFGTKADGEIGRVSFRGNGGYELSAFAMDERVTESVARYFELLLPDGDLRSARVPYVLDGAATFTSWVARSWMRLFAGTGLVIIEPALLRSASGELFERALRERSGIAGALATVAAELAAAGYRVPLDPATAGVPFHIGPGGRRIRIDDVDALLRDGRPDPTTLSTDAALRPIFADALLPNLAHVVGAGELAYHAMLKPLYEIFGVIQPAVLPRRSLTFMTDAEAQVLDRYGLTVEEALAGAVAPGVATTRLLGDDEQAEFARAAAQIRSAFQPLADRVSAVDPSLEIAWRRSLDHALHSLTRLRSRTSRSVLARRGYSRGVLHQLLNQLRPRGRPQERIFPVPHFLARFGAPFLQACLIDEPAEAFTHEVVTLPAAAISR